MSSPQFRSLLSLMHDLSDVERAELKKLVNAPASSPNELSHFLIQSPYVQKVLQHLSHDALSALKVWCLQKGSWRDMPQRQSRLAQGMKELARFGLVFETHYGPHRRIPVTPWELFPQALSHLLDIPWSTISVAAPLREIPPVPVWTPFWHDAFQILSYARQEPLLLTTQNDVYRRQKTKMEKILWNRPALTPDVVLNFLLVYLNREELLISMDKPYRLEPSDAMIERYFSWTPDHLLRQQAEFIFDPSRVFWPELLLISLASLMPPDKSLKMSQTIVWLARQGFDTVNNPYGLNTMIGDLLFFDLWELTGSDEGRLSSMGYALFQGRFEETEARQTLVQPTGEILVPPNTPLHERWHLDALATRVRSDRVSTYRLDQESVKRAIRRSLSLTDHLEQLTRLTRHPIPDNVKTNLTDWHRALRRHRIMEVTIVHSERPEDSREVEAHMRHEALGRLSPTDVIIDASRVKDVIRRLDKSGSPILPDIIKTSQPAAEERKQPIKPRSSCWTIHLFADKEPAQQSDAQKRAILTQAQRSGTPISIVYQAAEQQVPQEDHAIPITLNAPWVQIYLVEKKRYILVEWPYIISVAPR